MPRHHLPGDLPTALLEFHSMHGKIQTFRPQYAFVFEGKKRKKETGSHHSQNNVFQQISFRAGETAQG